MIVCRQWYFGLSNPRQWMKMNLSLFEVRKVEVIKFLSQTRFVLVEKLTVPVGNSNKTHLKEQLPLMKNLKHLDLEEWVSPFIAFQNQLFLKLFLRNKNERMSVMQTGSESCFRK